MPALCQHYASTVLALFPPVPVLALPVSTLPAPALAANAGGFTVMLVFATFEITGKIVRLWLARQQQLFDRLAPAPQCLSI